MVSIEPQRTHMFFDGLCDVFCALGAEFVERKVEGRQRPLGGVIIGISINNSSCTTGQIEVTMVSNEPQLTHMPFDCLCKRDNAF